MTLESQLGSWYDTELRLEFRKPYMKSLQVKLRAERLYSVVRPNKENVFRAYKETRPDEVKIVIIGQDPYPHHFANGLCFSANETMHENIPKSLQNIFTELENDIGFQPYHNPDLGRWARQGVMLLNRILTTKDGVPQSHEDYGWQFFTLKTIELICKKEQPVMFLLWGNKAQSLSDYIVAPHSYYCSPHPSPLSAYRGFFGSKPFSHTNDFLIKHNLEPIDWLNNEK